MILIFGTSISRGEYTLIVGLHDGNGVEGYSVLCNCRPVLLSKPLIVE